MIFIGSIVIRMVWLASLCHNEIYFYKSPSAGIFFVRNGEDVSVFIHTKIPRGVSPGMFIALTYSFV